LTGERVERRLAAVLAADVAGYSRLMGVDEEATLARLKAVRKAIVDPAIASHRGRIVKTTGDGMLVEFASAVDAVRSAVEVQRSMAEQNAAVLLDQRIEFRIGINVGDIIVDSDDIFGDGVNVAARVESQCEPSGVYISGNAFEQIRGKTDFTFDDLGEKTLKNIERPVRLYALRGTALATTVSPMSSDNSWPLPLPDKPSIAVLPFQNMSGDPEQEYFADGMVEEIITALSRFKSLFVIARNSSFMYKGKAIDIKQVGRELGVRYVLEGSVRKSGNRVRITGQLIEASTGAHLWADRFDGDLQEVFELQDRITSSVVGIVAPTIEHAEIERAKHRPTDRLDSYDLYLRGMTFAHRGASEALELFRKAIEKDQEFAAAYLLAAFVLMVQQGRSGLALPKPLRDEALQLVEHAVRLGRDDAAVLVRSAHVFAYLGHQYDRATLLADEAVVLNGNLAIAWHSQGWVKLMCVQPDLAIESFQRTIRLSPLDPLTSLARCGIAFGCFQASRYEEGFEITKALAQMAPSAHSSGAFIINAVSSGRVREAAHAAARLLEIVPAFRVSVGSDIFPMRSAEMQNKIAEALRAAGVPD
jgi:TolB-like protein/class 3 adenylate cyclase